METIDNQAKALATLADGSLKKRASSNVHEVLAQRMTLSEAIEAATQIIDAFPNGGRDAGKGYIGALAATLASYPRQVAMACADQKGIVREVRFLPTVADLVAWCERGTEPLRRQADNIARAKSQLRERTRFEAEQASKTIRPTMRQMQEKYGETWGISLTDRECAAIGRQPVYVPMTDEELWQRAVEIADELRISYPPRKMHIDTTNAL